jgi:hypothetical protein
LDKFENKKVDTSEYILEKLYSHALMSGFNGFGISILEEMLKNFESREMYEECSIIKKEITKKEKNG